ncbi:HipA family kinase [Portibacter marinus]|uniref:HipA family kinase n=1 Tax=Portibacter marinus TaxID=2898660 RepID=UPI001F472B1D|nr:HipA family kinase [Portibacter marinus]
MNISRSNAISILKEFATSGHRPLLVLADSYEKYVVKNGKGRKVPLEILNEFICTSLLSSWNLPFAEPCLIKVDTSLLESANLSSNQNIDHFTPNCFGSKYLENSDDVNNLILATKNKHDFNKILNPMEVIKIGLFDTWVENLDRRNLNYNLMLTHENGKIKFTPIDHCFVFNQLEYKELNPAVFNPSANEHLLDSELGVFLKKYIPITPEFLKSERDYFYYCIGECKKNVIQDLNFLLKTFNLPENTFIPLQAYLFDENRSGKVFEEFKCRMLL